MGWLKNIFSSGAGDAVAKIGGVVNQWQENHLGKKERDLAIAQILHERDMATLELATATIGAKERVMVAELKQDDPFTKRARPMIVYVGLVAAIVDAINYIDFTMPSDFWYVWGGVCGVYAIGRSAEKRGNGNKVTRAITGSMLEG